MTAMDWQDISTAPKDGTSVQARIPGHGEDNVISWQEGLVDEDENSCGGWHFMGNGEPPDDWTDGICWASNEDDKPSTQPTYWKPLA